MNPQQIDAIKRLGKAMSMHDGSANECHEYYCPYNIGMVDADDNGIINEEEHGIYHGKPDGFDSECPRFLAIDREKGKWDCLCGLDVIARMLGTTTWHLYKEILFETNNKNKDKFPDILGFNPRWRHLNLETGESEKQ